MTGISRIPMVSEIIYVQVESSACLKMMPNAKWVDVKTGGVGVSPLWCNEAI